MNRVYTHLLFLVLLAGLSAACGDSVLQPGGAEEMPHGADGKADTSSPTSQSPQKGGPSSGPGQCDDPCGGECCAADDVCLFEACVTPGAGCEFTEDCAADEVCEPSLGRCLPRDQVDVCTFVPPVGEFSPQVDCRWTPQPGDAYRGRKDVVATPVVGNLTDDNGDGRTDTDDIPEIAFLTYDLVNDSCCNAPATLRIVSGECGPGGTMPTTASLSEPAMDNSAGLALGDLDGDGVPEIVAITRVDGRPQGTVAWTRVSPDGSEWRVMWHNERYPTWDVHTRGGGVISLADLDADGTPEVVIGNVALDGVTGELEWDGVDAGRGAGIGNNGFLGPSSTVADVNRDGMLEVVAGNTLYSHSGEPLWTFDYHGSNSACGGGLPCDGFSAVANFDGDEEAEIVIVRLGEVFVLEHDGELVERVKIPTDDCEHNESGPPTVADFDGDGRPEIGTAAADFYTVIDLDCLGDRPQDGCREPGVLWAVPNEDCSSRVTASSVFDFEGDGRAEMVYADETTFRIFDGRNGEILFEDATHGSHTRIEMPVVVDADNDGNAEVIIPENGAMNGTPGLEVWADADDNWVRTRRIWNQHGYHVTNVEEDGTIPSGPDANWLDSRLNNFRQNVQPEDLFFAPNLVVESVEAAPVQCAGAMREIELFVTVQNRGSLGVSPGVSVRISGGGDEAELETSKRLLPGQSETLSVVWTVSDGALDIDVRVDADQSINECEEGDNDARLDAENVATGDLVVDAFSVDATSCGMNGDVSLSLTVRNAGDATVDDASVGVGVRSGGETVGSVDVAVGRLEAGATREVSQTWSAPASARGRSLTFDARPASSCGTGAANSAQAECRVVE